MIRACSVKSDEDTGIGFTNPGAGGRQRLPNVRPLLMPLAGKDPVAIIANTSSSSIWPGGHNWPVFG